MTPLCDSCGEPLDPADTVGDMGSAQRRFRCLACGRVYESNASGLLVEVDDPGTFEL